MLLEPALLALSPLDGRYYEKCQELHKIASEYGLMYYRLQVEIRWLQSLSTQPAIKEVPPFSMDAHRFLQKLLETFNEKSAADIKAIESKTNHDVKAIEYYLKDAMKGHSELNKIREFVHFACTSEDINNLAYGLMLKDIRTLTLVPSLNKIINVLGDLALKHAATPMLSRTHGQSATPTTLGKEMANVKYRLMRQVSQFEKIELLGKMNGAVGNFNAHVVAYPEVDWITLSKELVNSLGLHWEPLTTQIEPHDCLAEYFDNLKRINTILIDFCRDMWGYISLHYFVQAHRENEVGSSTMPHKVNPIDFENAEGNLGLANALFSHFSEKLPISRWQRDLSDSTVLRNVGVGAGYMLIALKSVLQGIAKVSVNTDQIKNDLNQNWEVLAEPIQTVMRRYGIDEPYEKLKKLTRGKRMTPALLHQFIDSLTIPYEVKTQLKALTPENYTGLATELVGYANDFK